MNSKQTLAIALVPFMFAGCNTANKPTKSIPGQVMDIPPAPPGPNQGIEVPVSFNGQALGAKPQVATVDTKDGVVKVAASEMSDLHALSEPITLNTANTYVIKGMVKGTDLQTSKAPFAAGIGLLGEKLVVEFPTGTYDWKPFEGTFTVTKTGPKQITIGIGGWKTGQGTIEIKDLKMYK
jgi:hypothetical protein